MPAISAFFDVQISTRIDTEEHTMCMDKDPAINVSVRLPLSMDIWVFSNRSKADIVYSVN
jgi:hypothetical protein